MTPDRPAASELLRELDRLIHHDRETAARQSEERVFDSLPALIVQLERAEQLEQACAVMADLGTEDSAPALRAALADLRRELGGGA